MRFQTYYDAFRALLNPFRPATRSNRSKKPFICGFSRLVIWMTRINFQDQRSDIGVNTNLVPFGTSRSRGVNNFGLTELFLSTMLQYLRFFYRFYVGTKLIYLFLLMAYRPEMRHSENTLMSHDIPSNRLLIPRKRSSSENS